MLTIHTYMVANPSRGQLNREKCVFPCPRSRLTIWSRETGSAASSRVSLLILRAQVESGAYSRDSSCFPRRRSCIPPTATQSVPNLSGHANAYRWGPLPESAGTGSVVLEVVRVRSRKCVTTAFTARVRWHRASSPQGDSRYGSAFLGFTMGQFFCARLFCQGSTRSELP